MISILENKNIKGRKEERREEGRKEEGEIDLKSHLMLCTCQVSAKTTENV